MSFEPREYLRHILAEADYLVTHSRDLTRETFHADETLAGMRDRLIHDYFSVDYDLVWDVVANKIPDLKRAIERLFQA